MNSSNPTSTANTRSRLKRKHELDYWHGIIDPIRSSPERMAQLGAWYEYFFTAFFGLTRSDYAGKRLLDVGCGPMGSLEWADIASERVGLDPLAEEYRSLVEHKHAMRYCAAPAEAIPYPDGYFDFVSTFNSLDHVDDVDLAIGEIKRVVRPKGSILLIVEINHDATFTEPHRLDRNIVDRFSPEFEVVAPRLFGIRDQFDLYGALKENLPYEEGSAGLLACRFERRSQP